MIVIVCDRSIIVDMGKAARGNHFLDHGRQVRQAAQRVLVTVNRKSTLSGPPAKSLPDLGMYIPSTLGQIDHEIPLKPSLKLILKGRGLSSKECCPSFSSLRIKPLATAVPALRYTLKGIQGKDYDEALCTLGKLAELALRELEISRRKISMNLDSYIFPYLEKH